MGAEEARPTRDGGSSHAAIIRSAPAGAGRL
jgi:hypothetical protein